MQPVTPPLLICLNELQLHSNLHCGHRGFVPLLYAMEPVSLAVRFPRQSAVRLGFSAMSRGSAPSLIPLIGGCPPGSTAAAGEFRGHSHFPVSLFIHKSGDPDTVPNPPQRCTGQPSRRSSRECACVCVCVQLRPWAANALTDKTSCQSVGNTISDEERAASRLGGQTT